MNIDFPAWMIESLDREAQRLNRLVTGSFLAAGAPVWSLPPSAISW